MYNMHLFLFIMCIIKKKLNHMAKQTKQTTAEGFLLVVTKEEVREMCSWWPGRSNKKSWAICGGHVARNVGDF